MIGTFVSGSTALGIEGIASLIKDWGGKHESAVIGFDFMVPWPSAAFVNDTMGHVLDYDDTHDKADLHSAIMVVPAAFAIAQRRGKVNGKELITAVTLGWEIIFATLNRES